MACDIDLGRLEPCKDSVGGINAVYFINYGDFGAITYNATDEDVIDSIAGTPSAYKFDVRGNSSYVENIQSSRENGTTAFEQVLELTLKKITKEDHKTVKLLAFGRPNILVEDNNGNVFTVGLLNGTNVTGGTIVSGTAMADLNGYTLSFTGMERTPANFLNKTVATETPAETIAGAGFTIVEGTVVP
tara:strand:+ start:747 stop:1310 length:564 start_codon:yes stop_codon:yes gene_type:complete